MREGILRRGLAVLGALAIAATATAVPWRSTISISEPGFMDVAPSEWTDGAGLVVGQGFTGGEDFPTPGAVSQARFLPRPQDYHSAGDVFTPGIGPGFSTQLVYDLFWGPADTQITLPFLIVNAPVANTVVQIVADYVPDPLNPFLVIAIEGEIVYKGFLLDLVPEEIGLQPIGFVQLQQAPCASDFDGSGDVGFDDLIALLATWGPCPDGCATDVDGDGDVDFDDLLILLSEYGGCG